MDASTPAWLNTLTILGAILTIGAGSFLGFRISNARRTYKALRPKTDPREDDPSGTVVFIIVGFIVLALGLLLLGLGLSGWVRPDELGA